MTEIYSFFNSTPDDRRPKQAEDWANYFSKFLTTGLYHKNAEAGLAVTSDAQMRVLVDAGAAFFSGYMYENTAPLPLTVPLADNNRIDRVVVRLNLNEDQRNIRAHIKQGTEDEPPELQRDEWIYELSIARINVIGGQSFIEQSQIMDERYDEDVCGLVRSLLDLNVDEAMEHIDAEIQKFRDDFSNVNNYPMATQAQAEGASWLIAYMSPRNTRQLIQANTPYQIIHDQAIPNGTKELEVNIPNGSDVRGLKIQINTFLSLSNASGGSGSTTQGVIPYLVVGNTDINLVGHVGNLRLGGWNIASSFNDPGRVYERFAEAVWIWNQNNRIGTPASDNSRGLSKILTLDYNNTSPATYYNTNANLNSNNRKLKISIPQSAGILSADVSFRKGSRLKVWAIYDDWSF